MPSHRVASIKPIEEQKRALEYFLTGESLRIDAYAGTGKTTTLRLLAQNSPRRGLYLAFNRTIAAEARDRFPRHVGCTTIHSIAYRAVRTMRRYSDRKLSAKLTPKLIADYLNLTETVSFSFGLILARQSYSSVLIDASKRFLQSDDPEPTPDHIPLYGSLGTIRERNFHEFREQALLHLRQVWQAMCSEAEELPLGHDGYLKLWALSNPQPRFDYIMVDEAQDLNPVVLGVLRQVQCPVVYVGDPFQQIYEWRGAVNALEKVVTTNRLLLSQSFRFGPAIADAASVVIRELGAVEPLRGAPGALSDISPVQPDIILSRTNVGVIANVLQCLDRGMKCTVLGGTQELERLLEDVGRIKAGAPSRASDLLGFASWQDVMLFSMQQEGQYLRGLVSLVNEYGEERMLSAIAKCERQERTAEVICSTAHRAKGGEWDFVKLDTDFESAFLRRHIQESPDKIQSALDAEKRLLYVAMTRARRAIELPAYLLSRFNLKHTTNETLGRPQADAAIVPSQPATIPEANEPCETAPCVSLWKDAAEEMDIRRQFFW